jgi:hypothetical protein
MLLENEHEYKFMKLIDFKDESIKSYRIDTRDFYCFTSKETGKVPDLSTVKNYPLRFFNTPEEVMSFLDRVYNESGGNVKWRHLSLTGEGAKASYNWNMKYITVYRTEYGMIVCNRDKFILSKKVLESPVEQEYLNPH